MSSDVRKPFNKSLHGKTRPTQEFSDFIFPILNILVKPVDEHHEDDFEIDSLWMLPHYNNLDNIIDGDIVAGVEWEHVIEENNKWLTNMFPYPTASLLPRKERYKTLPYPAFFIRVNRNKTDAYAIEIHQEILNHTYRKDINRTKTSMSPEGEERINVPLGLTMFGFENIEPFVALQCYKRTFKNEDIVKNKFKEYCKDRELIGRPVEENFYLQMNKIVRFLEKNKS